MKISEFNNLSLNEAVDYYYHDMGINPLPVDSKTKRPLLKTWEQWQHDRIPPETVEEWKSTGLYEKGGAIGLILGKLYRKYDSSGDTFYLVGVDLDNQVAIDKVTTINGTKRSFDDLIQEGMIIEQHNGTSDKAHILFLSHKPYKKLTTTAASKNKNNEQIPAIEIRSAQDQYIIVTPSFSKDGINKHQIIGNQDQELEFQVFDKFDKHIDTTLKEFGISYLEPGDYSNSKSYNFNNNNGKIPIGDLFKEDTVIYEGHNRHEAQLRVMDSLLKRNYGILILDQIKNLSQEWNQKHCSPPLDNKEFEKQWKQATQFIGKQIEAEAQIDQHLNKLLNQNQNQNQKAGHKYEKYPELVGNVYYQINEIPEKYVIAYKHKNHLIEAWVKVETSKSSSIVKQYLIHNKTFLACIPTKIIRHKSPLTFLQTQATFTISFIDAMGEQYTFSYKPLSTIVQSLKDLGLVLSDGSDAALAAVVQAYKQRNLIEDNADMKYVGFFKDGKDNRIITSNLEINEPSVKKLADALAFLDELKTHYENRLDLLATSIVWGMVAPAIFMLKTNNYFLKALNFYGFANSTKSNTGKIILALDGHQHDRNYSFNLNRIDSQARFGEAVSFSTFPILIDELDLNNEIRNLWLINIIKVIIDSQIARTKFPHSKAGDVIDIPALSPLIMTSNFSPPIHNSGYMRRTITRNFPINESWKQDDSKSKDFEKFLTVNLPRLKALGDFRNWYIVNHQAEILDVNRPEPLDLGLKILKEAFQFCTKDIPHWLISERIPENQLEESIEDSDVIVKSAFEKYINEQLSRAVYVWKLKLEPDPDKKQKLDIPDKISDRLVKLAKSNFLQDIKYSANNFGVNIFSGILKELYSHGVARDQLPNFKDLKDYIPGAEYRKYNGKKVIFVDEAALDKYFDSEI